MKTKPWLVAKQTRDATGCPVCKVTRYFDTEEQALAFVDLYARKGNHEMQTVHETASVRVYGGEVLPG